MFTGIVATTGTIESLQLQGDAARLTVRAPSLDLSDVALGDSIAVSGACLTVVSFDAERFSVDVSRETLDRTTLGDRRSGDAVNLEKALRLSDRLGGHIVTGHVDGIGRVHTRTDAGEYVLFRIEAPRELARYIAPKGSVCVDGVSLTVNAVEDRVFDLFLIPHTLEITSLGRLGQGDRVNLEIDIVARYIERLVGAGDADAGLLQKLRDSGFVRE